MSNSFPFLKILYFNAKSILPKLDELVSLIDAHTPDLICIVESWLDKGITDLEIAIPGYISLRSDRDRHGGGILIYIKNLLHFSTLPSPSSDIELRTIVIQHNVMPARISLSVFYRPPSSGKNVMLARICLSSTDLLVLARMLCWQESAYLSSTDLLNHWMLFVTILMPLTRHNTRTLCFLVISM